MDRAWLAERMESGASIEAIAREVGRDPSTVAYGVNKHGLRSRHAQRHALRGPLAREDLEPLVAVGMSIRQIARALERSPTTIRHWLRHHGLRTNAARLTRRDGSTADEVVRDCPRHGWTWFRRIGAQTHYRCAKCVVEAVSDRRRRIKEILVDDAGGRCAACGYGDCVGVLQFHHVDPATNTFHLGREGVARSLEKARAEARKCILLCGIVTRRSNSAFDRFP
jgi:transposase-like protein